MRGWERTITLETREASPVGNKPHWNSIIPYIGIFGGLWEERRAGGSKGEGRLGEEKIPVVSVCYSGHAHFPQVERGRAP